MAGGGARPSAAVVPTEDAMQALIEHLVDPVLVMCFSPLDPPDAQQEEAIAKQIHAVVVLYNYYHRKQFPQLPFLDFEPFCKVAVNAKGSLGMYMKFLSRCKGDSIEGLQDHEKHLSITEKMVMDACKICMSLDASRDAPDMEIWPISKVAVFLVDSVKEKCLLQFCTVTQGVWSVVEKDLDVPIDNLAQRPKMRKKAKGKKTASESAEDKFEDVLHQLALSAVKEKTGIGRSNLCVLEHHTTYSLNKEKATTQLFIIMYTTTENEEFTEVPIKDVLSSLRGPLFGRSITPEVTSVTEYYHLLPYSDILSDWQSRETCQNGSLHVVKPRGANREESFVEPDREPTLNDCDTNESSDQNESNSKTLHHQTGNIENRSTYKGSDMSLSDARCRAPVITDGFAMKLDKLPKMDVQTKNEKASCSAETMHVLCEKKKEINSTLENRGTYKGSDTYLSDASCRVTVITDGFAMKLDKLPKMGVQATNDKSSCSVETMHILSEKKNEINSAVERNKRASRSSIIRLTEDACNKKVDKSSMNHLHLLSSHVQDFRSGKNTISGAHIDKMEVISNQAVTVDSVENLGMAANIDGEHLGITATSNSVQEKNAGRTIRSDSAQDLTATCDLELVPKVASESQDTFRLLSVQKKNDLLGSSLRVLHKKRNELCLQQRLLADEVAQREMNIQKILAGGEASLTSSIELMLEACNDSWSSQTRSAAYAAPLSVEMSLKRRKLSEAVLSLLSPCQELDGICCDNNWILPRFCVLPSFADGMFRADIIIEGMDFKFTGSGDLKSSPLEARESAASHMLSKLRSMHSQA